jgi:hypothetical protein
VTLAVPFSIGTSLNFAPGYTPDGGWDTNFQASYITWTLKDDMGHTNSDFPCGIAPVNLYQDGDLPTFTQVFKHNDQEVGRRTVVALISTVSSDKFTNLYNNNSDWTEWTTIPAASLTLSKEVPL